MRNFYIDTTARKQYMDGYPIETCLDLYKNENFQYIMFIKFFLCVVSQRARFLIKIFYSNKNLIHYHLYTCIIIIIIDHLFYLMTHDTTAMSKRLYTRPCYLYIVAWVYYIYVIDTLIDVNLCKSNPRRVFKWHNMIIIADGSDRQC